jgi:enoyl-CoA hydratase/carnithine racemase
MKTIATATYDGTQIIKLERGAINALDLELMHELSDALDEVKNNSEIHSLVLSSASDKFFSIGFDIPGLFELSKEDFKTFFQAFNRLCLKLYALPKPTIAAITGHAIAGGCILVLCCDERFIAAGRRLIGLNEVKLGVPVPYVADCLLRDLIGTRLARQVMESGEFYMPEEAQQMGMVDRVLPSETVLPEALERAQALGSLPLIAMQVIKTNRVERVVAKILALLEGKEETFIECWYSSDTRARLREAMAKF